MTTGTPGDSATLGGELCPDIYRPRLTGSKLRGVGGGRGEECRGGAMSAVPFVAAATEEVGCLWSWTQGAHRRVGDSISLSVPCSVHAWYTRSCWAPGTGRQAGDFSRGSLCTFQGPGPRRNRLRCFRRPTSSGLPRKWF